jgi:hypothetical protein
MEIKIKIKKEDIVAITNIGLFLSLFEPYYNFDILGIKTEGLNGYQIYSLCSQFLSKIQFFQN